MVRGTLNDTSRLNKGDMTLQRICFQRVMSSVDATDGKHEGTMSCSIWFYVYANSRNPEVNWRFLVLSMSEPSGLCAASSRRTCGKAGSLVSKEREEPREEPDRWRAQS